MSKEEEKQDEELPEFDGKDVFAFIIAMYRTLLPQFLIIVLIFFLVAYILLNFWFN